MEIGKQYNKDDAFKAEARLHQSKFRMELGLDYNEYGNRLTDKDAKKNYNYYDGLNIVSVLRKRYPHYSQVRDADMLRSEHIPLNFFAPLVENKELAKKIFNIYLNNEIKTINTILIEYAPEPKEHYLNDRTSFDTYIEFVNNDNKKCGIGIEVKYTEREYSLGKTEGESLKDKNSPYYKVSEKSEIYINNPFEILKKDEYRQVWRNHILGESMKPEISEFYSLIVYPRGNTHFEKLIPEYTKLLKEDKKKYFKGITFEDYITNNLRRLTNGNKELVKWVDYLEKRYLF